MPLILRTEVEMKSLMLRLINKIFALFNAKIISNKQVKKNNFEDTFVKDAPENKIVSVDSLSVLSDNIRGMISSRDGEHLFSLAYMQRLSGDVVEIGSFQGKSTYFLGSAVKFSGNGKMQAIDHFKGNLGAEKYYRINKNDLSDLEQGFRKNIKHALLENIVILINKPNFEAVKEIEDNSVRFLFIDGDHTAKGVTEDLKLFRSKLKRGAIVAFDDYSPEAPGVVEVANKFLISESIKKKYLLGRILIVELPN
jgi:predicted O-methyltransferase YrrM